MCLVVALTLNLFTPLAYADNVTSDSISSVNREDDGVSIGVDKTQEQQTTYNDETTEPINGDSTQDTYVYVSQASTFSVTIPKIIILDGKKDDNGLNKGAYVVSVDGNFGGEETINVVPEDSVTLKQLGKNDIVATIEQDKESWAFDELDIVGNGLISTSEMSAGSWNGSFVFNIKLFSNQIYVVSAIDENGTDLNGIGTKITNTQSLLKKLEETNLIEINEIDIVIEVTIDDFAKKATVTFDVNNVAMSGDSIALFHYDEENENWEYVTTAIVDENGCIVVDFTSLSPIAFAIFSKNNEHIHKSDVNIITTPTCTNEGTRIFNCVWFNNNKKHRCFGS